MWLADKPCRPPRCDCCRNKARRALLPSQWHHRTASWAVAGPTAPSEPLHCYPNDLPPFADWPLLCHRRPLQELITDLAATLATLKVCKGESCVVKSLSVTEPQPV